MTLLLLNYACGNLVFGKNHLTFCFGTAQPRRAVPSPGFKVVIPQFSPSSDISPYGGGQHGASHHGGEIPSGMTSQVPPHPAFLPQCASSVPSIFSSIVSSLHSPSTQAPLQSLPHMIITIFERDVVLKAVPKTSTCSPTHTLLFTLIRPARPMRY